jgi:hypothetical protein
MLDIPDSFGIFIETWNNKNTENTCMWSVTCLINRLIFVFILRRVQWKKCECIETLKEVEISKQKAKIEKKSSDKNELWTTKDYYL